MERVTIYLLTSLFAFPGDAGHLPVGVSVVEGTVVDRAHGAISVFASRLLDERGRELYKGEINLAIPWSKIDHVHLHP